MPQMVLILVTVKQFKPIPYMIDVMPALEVMTSRGCGVNLSHSFFPSSLSQEIALRAHASLWHIPEAGAGHP